MPEELQNFFTRVLGVPVYDDKKLFELLVLSQALAELSWPEILHERYVPECLFPFIILHCIFRELCEESYACMHVVLHLFRPLGPLVGNFLTTWICHP